MAKILIVDDDNELRNMVKSWFEPQHMVETGASVKEALDQLATSTFDAIILDLGLPDGDGLEIVKTCRNCSGDTPIIVLSGRQELDSKVTLIDAGADDYLTKPFHFKELNSRVKALLRRPAGLKPDVLTAGDIELNLTKARVTRNGEEINLTPKELALLEFFMRHPEQVFSQEAIMQRVWTNDSEASPDIIRVYLTKVRKKLEKKGEAPLFINQRGHGYLFSPPESRKEE